MRQLFFYGGVFLSGVLVGWGPLSYLTDWELSLVRKNAADQGTVSAPATAPSQPSSKTEVQPAQTTETATIEGSQPATADLAPAAAGRIDTETADTAQDRTVADPFLDPDEAPPLAPPPHLSDAAEFTSLFDAQDHIDERIDDLEAMIEAMERDGLPEEHIAFMRQSLLAEENSDPVDFEPFFEEPEPSFEDLRTHIIESYGSQGASPEEIEEMLEVLREDFDGSAGGTAEFDLHSPPDPVD